MIAAIILAIAIAVDLVFGDPPTPVHPVGWIGRLIGLLTRFAPTGKPLAELVYGAAMVALTVAITGGVCYYVLDTLRGWQQVLYVIAAGLVLKSTFSIRGLIQAAQRVKLGLVSGDLQAARRDLRALVSRDTTQLTDGQVASGAVESVAENIVDSFVGPVFFFALFTVTGPLAIAIALCYRVVNTFDSMVGYHGRYEYLGKVAARADDVLNWLPARLGTLCLVAAAAVLADGKDALRVLFRDHRMTESPNAGWAMSAAAGALGVRLEKPAHYTLGDGPEPDARTIGRMCTLGMASMLLFAVLAIAFLLLIVE